MQYVIITEAEEHTHADARVPRRGGSVMTWRLNGEEKAQDNSAPHAHRETPTRIDGKIQGESVFFPK